MINIERGCFKFDPSFRNSQNRGKKYTILKQFVETRFIIVDKM